LRFKSTTGQCNYPSDVEGAGATAICNCVPLFRLMLLSLLVKVPEVLLCTALCMATLPSVPGCCSTF